MNLLIFGPQGSGKGTQADKLAEKYNLEHIETGLIFREIAKEKTSLGEKILDLNNRKEMIPDSITVDVLKYYLGKVPADKGVIIDSAPRTMGQVAPVEKMFQDLGRSLDKVIYITLSNKESIARISKRYMCSVCYRHFVIDEHIKTAKDPCPTCGGPIMQRGDDTPDGVAKRLKVFYSVTMPVVEHYREKKILIEVDGEQSVEKVFEDITVMLNPKS
jgi:adenylate kinase